MKVFSLVDANALFRVSSLELFADSISERLPLLVGPKGVPADTGAKTSIARELATLLLQNSEIFLYVRGWKVWPSAENMDLFHGYRSSRGEDRPLWEAQVHLFSVEEKATFFSILSMGLYFF